MTTNSQESPGTLGRSTEAGGCFFSRLAGMHLLCLCAYHITNLHGDFCQYFLFSCITATPFWSSVSTFFFRWLTQFFSWKLLVSVYLIE